MKKKIYIFLVVLLCTTFFIDKKIKIYTDDDLSVMSSNETKGVFFSYIEFELFKNKSADEIKQEIDKVISTLKEYDLNTLYLHVRPFSDAIYNSKIFPSSRYLVSNEGDKLDIDILDYFIKKGHENNIKVHAWINPYRISNQTDSSVISKNNPAYKWLNTDNVKIISNKGIFYNPSSADVINLIVSGVKEIIDNYSIDGIILDDYFYPDKTIDVDNYNKLNINITIDDYRRGNVNELIKKIYTTIKDKDKKILFGISPQGNIENNYNECYADIFSWLSKDGYIDYIMPQLYYGFLNEAKPFIKTLNEWKNLIKNNVKIIPALALYKSNTIDTYAKSGSEEWVLNNDIIKRQINYIEENNIDGYSLFSYRNLLNTSDVNLLMEQKYIKEVNN